jgi:catechol 2,3-dioxygenase-like lactoylglutathione lyase family enzyme
MLGKTEAVANLAVKDVDVARRFYEGTLGLKPVHEEGGELVVYESGGSHINVYRSQYAGTNEATALTWDVDDVEKEVGELKAKGVSFEHYDMPDMKREGDIHVADGLRLAWFKDPDGNILGLFGHVKR